MSTTTPPAFDPDTEKLYTTSQVAEMFSVSKETVRDWIKTGQMPAVRIGTGHFRVRRSTLVEFAEARFGIVSDGPDEPIDAELEDAS